MKLLLLVISITIFSEAIAQKSTYQSLDLTLAGGESQGTLSISAWQHWKIGKKQRLEISIGPRISGYAGTKKDFWTAPAKLSRGNSIPFVVVLASQEAQNWDTLTVQRPGVIALNAALQLSYRFLPKWKAAVNIDLLGYTVGRNTGSVFTADGQQSTIDAKPDPFNLLLTGDLDKGTLNSEFYIQYSIHSKWHLRAVYQFYFVEYQTPVKIQQFPSPNDRFRNKANLLGVGLSYSLN